MYELNPIHTKGGIHLTLLLVQALHCPNEYARHDFNVVQVKAVTGSHKHDVPLSLLAR